jgi:hypothetical protein
MDQQVVSFHDRAAKAFATIFGMYQQSVGKINRQGDENVFQQLTGMYAHQLNRHLHDIVSEITGTVAPVEQERLRNMLLSLVEEYNKEFLQKVRSL